MKYWLLFFAFLLGAAPVTNALAYDPYSAGWLRDFCAAKPDSNSGVYCVLFIGGLLDGDFIGRTDALAHTGVLQRMGKAEDVHQRKYSAWCIPKGVGLDQLGEMFVKYMNERPEKLHDRASFQFSWMLQKHFPCTK